MKKFLILSLILLLQACASYHYNTEIDDSKASFKNNDVAAKLSFSGRGADIRGYRLIVVSKSEKDIEIDWNKTSFIIYGQTQKGFMKIGDKYIDKDNYKNPTLVIPHGQFNGEIYPSSLIDFVGQGQYAHWQNQPIPDGETGVYLVLKVGNKEIKEQLLLKKRTDIIYDD